MHRWRVTYFDIFLHDILHMHLSAGLAQLLHQGYWQLDAEWLGLKLQTGPDPLFLEPLDSKKETNDTLSVFLPNILELQPWPCDV